ncbi:protein-glutamate methylesterase [Flavobacteriaceae bacterium UJ101]|nr:protein-glutamate methylesterase [Flavobacteriaceae bacterium UJ101]
MKAIIVDDDILSYKILKDFCEKTGIEMIQYFENPISAIQFLKNNEVDLVFLDIHMPELNGFEVLKNTPKTAVIITTTDETKAVEAFDYEVIDFLLKPISIERFIRSINRIQKTEKEELNPKEYLYVNINKRLIKVKISDIDFVQAKGNYVLFNLFKGDNLIVHTTLKKINAKLPQSSFIQVHRSYIINIKQIVDIEDSTIVINKKVIPLGKNYRESLFNKLNLLT